MTHQKKGFKHAVGVSLIRAGFILAEWGKKLIRYPHSELKEVSS